MARIEHYSPKLFREKKVKQALKTKPNSGAAIFRMDHEGKIDREDEYIQQLDFKEWNLFKGKMYLQERDLPTCVPWSLANSLAVLGLWVDSDIMQRLLKYAGNGYKVGGVGIAFDELISICEEYPYKNFSIRRVEENEWVLPFSIPNDFSLNNEFIKQARKRNQSIIACIDSELFYYKSEDLEGHAVCLSGYREDYEGKVDLQVLDPSNGKIWVPDGRFYCSMTERPLVIERLNPPTFGERIFQTIGLSLN